MAACLVARLQRAGQAIGAGLIVGVGLVGPSDEDARFRRSRGTKRTPRTEKVQSAVSAEVFTTAWYRPAASGSRGTSTTASRAPRIERPSCWCASFVLR